MKALKHCRVMALVAGLATTTLGCTSGGDGGGNNNTGGSTSQGGSNGGNKAGNGGNSGGSNGGNKGGNSGGNSGGSTGGSSGGSNGGNKGGSSGGSTGGSSGGSTGGNKGGSSGGSSGGSTGGSTGGSAGGSTGGTRSNGCAVNPDMISDFEEGAGDPAVLSGTDVKGKWEMFNDGLKSATQTMKVESSGDTTDCKKYALHTTGSGWSSYVGIGLTHLAGTDKAPVVYPNTKSYTGIKFRAKLGSSHPTNSPVRFNISTPDTEGKSSGGNCTDLAAQPPYKIARPCYQHVGRFLNQDYELSTQWKEVSFCFDRDLYPLSLPSNLTNAQRDNVAKNMMKVQFQFNQAKDWTVTQYPNNGKYQDINKTTAFDFWVDDVQFFTGECPAANFKSSDGTKAPFPQNKAPTGGSCELASNASKYNKAISQIYARWLKTFTRAEGNKLKVIAPEQENGVTTSEAMGYGMMIAAAMGDKDNFDKMWSYVQGNLAGGLMTWKPGGNGSATDGDEDIIYGLYMADLQWGGYKSAADAMAKAFSADVDSSGALKGGSGYPGVWNPSYFSPAMYRKFGGLESAITKNYTMIAANMNEATAGLPTDWGDPSTGKPVENSGAQVKSGLTGTPPIFFGFDAARVPWRLGLDACTAGSAQATPLLKSMVSFFAPKYDGGDTIDLLAGGWHKSDGAVAQGSVTFQGSFIGPMGIAGMAAGGSDGNKVRDRAFRAILDIMDYGDYNHTYFPSTVGFLTLLFMSGNFPMP